MLAGMASAAASLLAPAFIIGAGVVGIGAGVVGGFGLLFSTPTKDTELEKAVRRLGLVSMSSVD